MLYQPLPQSPFNWTNDPVSFQSYRVVLHRARARAPVVGTGGRMEELPRAVAQRRLRAVLRRALRRARARPGDSSRPCCGRCGGGRWTRSPQGPVYLGYRLGHIKGESRVFRALVYNKGAMVLHMLRRLMGDEAFFAGLRDFYATWRYTQGGHRRFPRRDGEGRRPAAGALLRALDLRQRDSAPSGSRRRSTRRRQLRVRFEQTGRSSTFRSPSRSSTPTARRRTSSSR